MKTRRQFSPDFKAKAALEAIKGHRTTNEIASEFEVHPIQLGTWKRAAVDGLPGIFSAGKPAVVENEALISALYQEIGQLKIELDWLKKKSGILKGRTPFSR
jgi:transposase-like protein